MEIVATGVAGPGALVAGSVADSGGEGFVAALGAGDTGSALSGGPRTATLSGAALAGEFAPAVERIPATAMTLPLLANAAAVQASPSEPAKDVALPAPAVVAGVEGALMPGPVAAAKQLASSVPAAPAVPAEAVKPAPVGPATPALAEAVPPTPQPVPGAASPVEPGGGSEPLESSAPTLAAAPHVPAKPGAGIPAAKAADKKSGKSAEDETADQAEPIGSVQFQRAETAEHSARAAGSATDVTTGSTDALLADLEVPDTGADETGVASGADALSTVGIVPWAQIAGATQPDPPKSGKDAASTPKEFGLGEAQRAEQLLPDRGAGTPRPINDDPAPAAGQFARAIPGATWEPATPQANGAAAQPATIQPNSVLTAGQPTPTIPQGPAPVAAPAAPNHVAMAFRPDKVAREMGLEIARRVSGGGNELLIRLDPAQLGRINIRMSVNEQGHLRAVVAADAPAVLDAIRSNVSELNRALEQAGVRTDSQSFRFDRGGSGDQNGQWQQRYQKQTGANHRDQGSGFAGNEEQPNYRPMATNGRVNMMA